MTATNGAKTVDCAVHAFAIAHPDAAMVRANWTAPISGFDPVLAGEMARHSRRIALFRLRQFVTDEMQSVGAPFGDKDIGSDRAQNRWPAA